eukprot:3205079-Rhodomonas_salina.2
MPVSVVCESVTVAAADLDDVLAVLKTTGSVGNGCRGREACEPWLWRSEDEDLRQLGWAYTSANPLLSGFDRGLSVVSRDDSDMLFRVLALHVGVLRLSLIHI